MSRLPCLAALGDEVARQVVAGLVAAVAAVPGCHYAALAGTDADGREVWAEFRRPLGRGRDLDVRLFDDHPCELLKRVLPGGGTIPGALGRMADRRWRGRASAAALMAVAEEALALATRRPRP